MRKRCLILLLLYSALVLLLFALLLQDGAVGGRWSGSSRRSRSHGESGWNLTPQRLCPTVDASMWEEKEVAAPAGSPQPRTHVYVHATWRSGSSFLGEIFNQHPRVFYLYEPAWHMWQSLYPGDAQSLQGALRDLFASLFRCDFSALRLYTGGNTTTAGLFGWKNNKVICSAPLCAAGGPRGRVGLVQTSDCQKHCSARPLRELERECSRYPVVVIKDVRLLELSALLPLLRDPRLNVRVVQLFRDPRAVHNSRLRSKRSLLRESLQVLRSRLRGADAADRVQMQQQLHHGGSDYLLNGALEVICQAWMRDLLLLRDPAPAWLRQRYLKVRYEDLVLQPKEQLDRLLRFVGLPGLPELEDFVVNMTRGPSYDSNQPFLVSARDAREVVGAWRERLSTEQVRRVEEACRDVMTVLSYGAQTYH